MKTTASPSIWSRLGLRFQLAVLVTAVVAVMGLLLGTLWTWKSQQILDQELRQRGHALAQMAAEGGRFATFTEQASSLRPLLAGIVHDDEVVYGVFANAEGEVIARQVDEEFEGNLEAILRRARAGMGFVLPFTHQGADFYDIHAPVRIVTGRAGGEALSDGGLEPLGGMGDEIDLFDTGPGPSAIPAEEVEELVGTVHVGISLARLKHETMRTVLWTAGLTMLIVALAIGVALVAAGRIFRPVVRMVELANGIARGDYSQTIQVERSDELGSLAEAFRQMQENLQAVASQARAIAEGDLTRKVEGEGDLAEAFNRMVESLAGLVGQIKKAGVQIAGTSNKILAASRQQEDGSQHQAASISQTTTTMDELLAASRQIAASSDAVVEIAEQTLASAKAGQGAVEETIEGMEEIRRNNARTAEQILALAEKNQQIGAIVEIIDEIADKTDLLALNAAIEGAKAGEAGKGFAIVATEMRALAENVVDSTKEIRDLISEIQKASRASVQATESQMKTTDSGMRLAVGTGEQLQRILEMVEQTSEAARQISLATQQQRTGTEQVVHSMADIAGIAKQNVQGSSDTTESAMKLSNLADGFRRAISRFHLGGEGDDDDAGREEPDHAAESW